MTTMTFPIRRVLRLAALVPMIALAAACGDDDATDPEPEPTFNRMVLTFTPAGGTASTVTITRANAAVSGPLTIAASGGTLTATFLNADGSADQVIAAGQSDFETRIVSPASPRATFVRTGPNTFTVTRSSAGTETVTVSLYHLGEQHNELQATVSLNVQ